MTILQVVKRSGAIVPFEAMKIRDAIHKAMEAAGEDEAADLDRLVELVVVRLETKWEVCPQIETIQDMVEMVLAEEGYIHAAKAYILYRQKRTETRQEKHVVIEVGKSIEEYLEQTDWRVNANANQGYSLGGLILNVSGKVTANYWLSHIYPEAVWVAHRQWDMHIHDLDMFSGYCAWRSLRQLIEEWFNGLSNRVESTPPRNLQSAVNQMINFLGTLQNERAGAQAFSSFDTYLAPFVHKHKEQLRAELDEVGATFASDQEKETYLHDKTYQYVVQQMQNFIFGLNVPSRWWTQTPFTNITLDRVCPDDLREKALFLGGIREWEYPKKFGELQDEMRMINKAIIEVYTHGDAKWRVFTFPIPTYNITEDFPWDDPDIESLFEMTAKYGIPYFQNFVGSQFIYEKQPDGTVEKRKNPHAYTQWAVRSMCCRLQLDLTQLTKRGNGLFGSAEMTWSIGVVTINVARIWYLFKGDEEGFLGRIRYLMDLAKSSLEIKRKELSKRLDAGLYPYTKRYLGSFRNHFSTIGINGMNEAIRNFTGDTESIATPAWKAFALKVLDMMREVLTAYQEETGNLYNLEATPAEWTTYRFAKEDKKHFPDILQAWTKDAPYYTNSTQLPVEWTEDIFEAMEQQNELQCRYTGGTVLHLYLGERMPDAKSCMALVKKVLTRYQLPYITVTPTFSVCMKHGHIAGEHDYCPRCDEEIGYVWWEEMDLALRSVYSTNISRLPVQTQ